MGGAWLALPVLVPELLSTFHDLPKGPLTNSFSRQLFFPPVQDSRQVVPHTIDPLRGVLGRT